MPVIDGIFVPRSPLTTAELHVDFLLHDNHVLERRIMVERFALPRAHRLAAVAQVLGDVVRACDDLTATLVAGLETTAQFGYRQAQRELSLLRADDNVTAAANPPATPGRLTEIVRGGMGGVRNYIQETALLVADAVSTAVIRALHGEPDATLGLLVARKQAGRALHNGILELVGATLNLGRTVGAAELSAPPTFALRSEQLDKNTCAPCTSLHGTIVRFGSPQYFAVLPPTGCLGGGRCRALMVFADGPRQVRAPELVAA